LNLIGTQKTILAEFAKSKRGGWLSPFDPEYLLMAFTLEQVMCQDTNIQIWQNLSLTDASDEKIESKIREVAKNLGAYYGQDRPQCFDRHTDDFPYKEYLRGNT
jgi:hypothetical protein